MKRLVFALILLSSAASAAEKPVAAAFHAAFGKGDSFLVKKQGQLKENVKYTPGELVQAPFGPVLLSPGEVQEASHACSFLSQGIGQGLRCHETVRSGD